MSNKRITDLVEKTPTIDFWIEVVDPTDLTDSPDGSSFKSKLPIVSGTPQDLQSVLDEGGLWEDVGGSKLEKNADIFESINNDGVAKTSARIFKNKAGQLFINMVQNIIGADSYFSFNHINDLFALIRNTKITFTEQGIKIISRTNTDGFGVIINTDNLPSDINVQFGVGGGTVAYDENQNFIPLPGTEVGSPVTGAVISSPELNDAFNTSFATDKSYSAYVDIGIQDDEVPYIGFVDTTVGTVSGGLRFSSSGIVYQEDGNVVNGFGFDNPDFILIQNFVKGLLGNADYSANYVDNSYVQKKWVDDNFSKYLLKVITPTAPVTGTTAETVLYTWFVPANTFSTTDRIVIEDLTCVSNGTLTGTSTVRARFNTTSTVDTSTNNKLFATLSYSSGSGIRFLRAERTMDFIGGKIKGLFNLAGQSTDNGNSIYTDNNFDTTVDNWFFITIELASVTNSVYLKNLIIKR